jgi:hypothetical protein
MMAFLLEAIQAERKTDREEILARMDAKQTKAGANQERMNESLREEIKSGKAEMRSTVSDIERKMETAIHSIRY